jgi:hypothetical protein
MMNIPDTQEVFEIISSTAPGDSRLVLREFSMARYVLTGDEVDLLTQSTGPTQLHVSRTHYDLDAVKKHYNAFFQMLPVHEERDPVTGMSFVSFWHESIYADVPGGDPEPIRVQVMYWNVPDQSTTKAHTTHWLDQKLERINSQYMVDYRGCFPIWGDNHYSIGTVQPEYFYSIMKKYDAAGLGYMLFKTAESDGLSHMYTSYFPLPGGMYIEIKPKHRSVVAKLDVAPWIAADESSLDGSGSLYCYRFTCPA